MLLGYSGLLLGYSGLLLGCSRWLLVFSENANGLNVFINAISLDKSVGQMHKCKAL